ncbi:MAG: hypothetical protein ACJAW3_001103 [Lentimonas sp.]|jgi:hypothetical protein
MNKESLANIHSNPQDQALEVRSDPHDNWFFVPEYKWCIVVPKPAKKEKKRKWYEPIVRFARKIAGFLGFGKKIDASEVDVELTRSNDILSQYYSLREEIYQNDSGYKNYSGMENNFDKNGRIFVALYKGRVVAGARLVVSSDAPYLPHESSVDNFTYKEICRTIDMDLGSDMYCEVSALVIGKKFRKNLIQKMFKDMVGYCSKNEIRYIFGVANMKCNRDYRVSLSKIGIKATIIKDVLAPRKTEFNNIDSYPLVIKVY